MFGDPIQLDSIEEAESYQFLFSLYGHVDTIQTTRPYIAVSEYEGMLSTFEIYNVEVRYYTGEEWLYSNKSMRVMLVTDSGTDHLIHDLFKAGRMSSTTSTRSDPDPEFNPESFVVFPVVYHVIVPTWFDGDPKDYVSPADLNRNITILNKVFSGQTGELGVDTHIRFKPALTEPINYCGQDYYGITYNVYNENNIRLPNSVGHPGNTYNASAEYPIQPLIDYYDFFPANQYINIWVFDEILYRGDNEYGITVSPCFSPEYRNTPVIGIIKDVVKENTALRSRQLGYCSPHEMGHFFGLLHAWMERVTRPVIINGYPDFETEYIIDDVDDTPDALGPIYSCNYSNLDIIPYDNIMSYTPDGCRYRFTDGQVARMWENIDNGACGVIYDEFEFEPNISLPDDLLDIRIISPQANYICNDSDINIKIRTSDISVFERLEIEGEGDFTPLIFDDPEPVGDDTYIVHVDLQQPLPAGNYNFTLYVGENACIPIPKQYEIIPCNNNSLEMNNAQWYFDSHVTLDFRSGIADLGGFSAMDAHLSESGICDEEGNILFYTDGDNIWNGNHEQLVSELNQTIVYRGTIVLQMNENRYVVVSLCDNGHLFSRLLDGQGNIINTYEYNGTLYGGLTAVPCPSGGYWIISTKQGVAGLEIVTIKLTNDGTTLAYEDGIELNLTSGNEVDRKAIAIKASPDGKYIACAMAEQNLQVFYFNATHGRLGGMDCNVAYRSKSPSIAFSPNGRFMYVSDDLVIAQYDMKNDISCNCQGIPSNEIFHKYNDDEDYLQCELSIQEGPDGRIYISKHSDFFNLSRNIGVIMEPNNRASRFHGYEDCHVIENWIDYTPGTILQNRDNLPNLVDANNVDICAASFTICSSDCSLETLEVHNFSLSPSLTWTFYDMNGIYITSVAGQLEPDMSSITALNGYDSFIIEQTTGCGNIMRDTVIFNAVLSIVGTDTICRDGRTYEYGVSLQPNDHIITADWFVNGLLFDPNRLEYQTQARNTEQFTITCNATTRNSCMYTASFLVNETEISYVSTPYPYCRDDNQGRVEILINEDQATNALPLYNFYDEYGNEHSNESSFSVTNLPLGEYTFDITNDYCHYEDDVVIESALKDINVSVNQGCSDDTIRLWRNGNASLSGYSFTLVGYEDLIFSTEGMELMLVVNNHNDNVPLLVGSNCSIIVTGPAPDFCSLQLDLYINTHPTVNIITNLFDEAIGHAEIIISNVENPSLISFDGSNINFNVEDVFLRDEDGNLHYYILDIPLDQMNNSDYILRISYWAGNENCEIYNGPIKICNVKADPKIEYHCETADIGLEIAGDDLLTVEWERLDGNLTMTTIVDLGNKYYTELSGVPVGIYHYLVRFRYCIIEGTVEVLEMGEPEFTMEITNSGNSMEVCVDIISLPLGINVLVAHDAAGIELMNDTIEDIGRSCFESNGGYNVEFITQCDTIPVFFHVYNMDVNLESVACYKSEADISFEISGGIAPYTVTFTSGDIIITQTFNTSGPNVLHAEIIQGTECSLVVTSADGNRYVRNWETIDFISGLTTLPNSVTGQLDNSYIGGTYIVTSGLTFDHDVTFNGCTIYCTYEDYDDITSTQWTVNVGKTVTLDTCTIKAACPDKMWQGITVYGIRFSNPSYIRSLVNVNGSLIQDAVKAIESINNGTIIANGSNFENNQYGIYYNKFISKPYPTNFQQVISLRSRRLTANAIENCNFLTTRELNDETRYPKAGIYMDNVWGITLKGCKFINEMAWQTVSDPSQRGIGIHSVASSFEADSYNASISTFSGLHYGVYATGDCINRAIAVLNSDFDNSMFGIYVNENSGAKILNNNIDVMSSSILSSVTNFRTSTQGMYLNTSKSYNVEGNVISGGSTGMYINNSGVDASKIKNNTFSNAVNAIRVTRQNASSDGRRGIQILCNDFISNTNDINVVDGSMKLHQGTVNSPTGNQFSTFNPSRYQFKVQLSNTQLGQSYNIGNYTYYQHRERNNVGIYTRRLHNGRYTLLKVIPYTTEIDYDESYCHTRSYTVTGLISEILALEVSVAEKEKKYAEKLDGGNTSALLSQISQMSLFNMPPVWNFYKDGYLSDTVFLSLAEKIQYYPAYITSIFAQNSPLPSHIFNKVMDKDFSILLKLVLQLCQIGESPRVDAENGIDNLKQNILENETLLEYEGHNIDSIATDLETVVKYFEDKGTADAKERLFRLYISTYNYQMAGKMLTELQSSDNTKYGRYADIGWLYLHTISDTVDWKPDLQKNGMLLLSAIADSSYLYSGMAETLYEYAFDTILPKYTPEFEDVIAPKKVIAEEINNDIFSDLFEIYPNPTSDNVYIKINANFYSEEVKEYFSTYGIGYGLECLKIRLNLYDIEGHLLYSDNRYIDENMYINLKNYVSGTYMLEVRNCFDKVVIKKIIKL